jgi:hypothetical protein
LRSCGSIELHRMCLSQKDFLVNMAALSSLANVLS